MSDNEAEHEGNPSGALAGAEEQPVIAQPQVVQAGRVAKEDSKV